MHKNLEMFKMQFEAAMATAAPVADTATAAPVDTATATPVDTATAGPVVDTATAAAPAPLAANMDAGDSKLVLNVEVVAHEGVESTDHHSRKHEIASV